MNRLKFVDITKTDVHCSICFRGNGSCDCGDAMIISEGALVNGVRETRVVARRVSHNGFNYISGSANFAIGNMNYVTGAAYVIGPPVYIGVAQNTQMSVQPTGPTFPIR